MIRFSWSKVIVTSQTFNNYIQKFKGQLHSDIRMFSKNTFLTIIQQQNPEAEG